EQLVASNPESLEDRSALARAHRLAGIYRRESGDLSGSRESLERALAVLEDPAIAGRPRSNNFLSQIVVAADELARTHRKAGDLAAAAKAFHRLAVLWNNELGRDPHGNQMARFLGVAFCGYGSVLRAGGKLEESRQVYEDAVRLCKGLGLSPEELFDLAC